MIEVSVGQFWKRHVDHVKDYSSTGLSSAPERPETDDEGEYFGSPVGVSSEENSTSSEGTNTSATSAQDLDSELPSAVDRPTSGPVELPSRRYPEHQCQHPRDTE